MRKKKEEILEWGEEEIRGSGVGEEKNGGKIN